MTEALVIAGALLAALLLWIGAGLILSAGETAKHRGEK